MRPAHKSVNCRKRTFARCLPGLPRSRIWCSRLVVNCIFSDIIKDVPLGMISNQGGIRMARVAQALTCTPEEKSALIQLSRSRSEEARLVERAKIVLLCLDGMRNDEVAHRNCRFAPTPSVYGESGFPNKGSRVFGIRRVPESLLPTDRI